MTTFITSLLASFVGVLIGLGLFRLIARRKAENTIIQQFSSDPAPPPLPSETPNDSTNTDLYKIAESLQTHFDQSAHPKDLAARPEFEQGVALLMAESYSTADLLNYAAGTNAVICCLAFEALSRREIEEDISESILGMLGNLGFWALYFVFHVLNKHYPRPLIGAVISRVSLSWRTPIAIQILREFIESRIALGETPEFIDGLEHLQEDDQVENLENALREIGETLAGKMLEQAQQYSLSRFLKGIGRIWAKDDDREHEAVIEHDYLTEQLAALETVLHKKTPRSVLLVGESGVGKTVLVRSVAKRLQQQGWLIFEAGAAELVAGQSYIGELEGRVQSLLKNLARNRKTLWFVPNFQDLLWAGQHRYSQSGILDYIFSAVESGEIVLIGETQPAAYERLLQAKPRLRTALETARIVSLNDEKTLSLARHWVTNHSTGGNKELISGPTLHEAFQLSKQFLGEKASPGNLLQFLSLTRRRMLSVNLNGPDAEVHITLDDLLVTLAALTGLPISILDDRHGLDLEALREYFLRRVLGQPEAVDCLVERVAMIKAGVTDPKRPQGVFLFAGPTGTGKTEIAKTLAKFLFGSEERMIRIDMSELQGGNALGRIIGEFEENAGQTALVNQIRRQPFSVVLLDEFEKAETNVWDLFLQVFDDGRLTDRRGNTADFRHCIIIMTSNLGAAIPHGASVGFTQDSSGFSLAMVERTIGKTFRREFVNRLDRVVVFRPLSRAVMRDLLKKELNDVLQRRGLRNRDWAVEWDESAIEFLLDKGFTHDLGARPLKRAIERFLLSPLAVTIVNHQFPEGDQFLFVRSNGKQIEVEFVDPDASEKTSAETIEPAPPVTGERELEEIALDAQGTIDEVEFLQNCLEQIATEVEAEAWQSKKSQALLQTSARGFWESATRFEVLGTIEYMDRIEAGLRSGDSLLRRILGRNQANGRKALAKDRRHFPADLVRLVQMLAQQIYLLEIACDDLADNRPRDAFLLVEGGRDAGV
ncbi:MAG TPA: AAA family ATPase, partial [Blastocatellia bacterium]|nr:AAA family ATPase [Blastocatellia bacterium]